MWHTVLYIWKNCIKYYKNLNYPVVTNILQTTHKPNTNTSTVCVYVSMYGLLMKYTWGQDGRILAKFFFCEFMDLDNQVCSVKTAGYWRSSFSACLWTETKSRSINSQKRTRPISSHLDPTNLANKWFIIWLLVKFCLRDTVGGPQRARWLHLVCSGSQSQRAVLVHLARSKS